MTKGSREIPPSGSSFFWEANGEHPEEVLEYHLERKSTWVDAVACKVFQADHRPKTGPRKPGDKVHVIQAEVIGFIRGLETLMAGLSIQPMSVDYSDDSADGRDVSSLRESRRRPGVFRWS